MMYDINLLKQAKSKQLTKKSVKLARVFAGLFIILLIISFAVVFFEKHAYQTSIQNLTAQKQSLISTLQSESGKINSILLLNNRLFAVKRILNERTSYDKILQTILNQGSDQLTYTSINITGKTGSLTLTASSLAPLNDFLDKLKTLVKNKNTIASIKQNSLTVDNVGGVFTLDLSLTLL